MALTKTVRADWAAENPDIAAMIKAYALPTEKVNEMLAYYVDESGGDMEATAIHFLSNESVWESWVSADVAANVKSALIVVIICYIFKPGVLPLVFFLS